MKKTVSLLIVLLMMCAAMVRADELSLSAGVPANHTLHFEVGEGGTVTIEDKTYTGEFDITLPRFSDFTCEIAADAGHTLSGITAQNDVGLSIFGTELTVSGICTDNTIIIECAGAGRLAGDVNGDGIVNLRDSMLLQQYLADWEVEIITANADVNGDGIVNLLDSMLLQQYLADWDVVLI